jgi:hypothetical protein
MRGGASHPGKPGGVQSMQWSKRNPTLHGLYSALQQKLPVLPMCCAFDTFNAVRIAAFVPQSQLQCPN